MQINFPKIVREIDLGEYAPEMEGQKMQVWVNPPSADLTKLGDDYKKAVEGDEQAEQEYSDFLSVLLSQGADKIGVDDLKEMQSASADTDPAFWMWFQNRVITEINDHRLGRKKV